MPGHDVGAARDEVVDEMAAREPRGAGDENFAGHTVRRRYRGTWLSPPLNGEKLPRPASVNDRKKRWSSGMGETEFDP